MPVALPEIVLRSVDHEVGALCRAHSRGRGPDEVRCEYHLRGTRVTICETRPPWRDPGAAWTHLPIAQLRYVNRTWTIYWPDRTGKWHRYDLAEPSPDLRSLVAEIDADPTGIFWG